MKDREDKVRTLRLFQVADYIKNSHYPNATELCKKFEVSRSTMMRDIEFLQTRYNVPIEYDFVNRGYYYTDPTFTIQSIMLSEGELMTVATILPLMEQYKNTPLEATFKSIMMKMIEMLPNKVEIDSPFSTHHVQFIKDPLPEISEATFNSVFDSIRSSKTMEFSYRSISKQSYTRRRFDPYKVLCQKGNWYVIGYCHLHERFNVYSLSRMKDVQISNDAFEIKKDFKLTVYSPDRKQTREEKNEILLFVPDKRAARLSYEPYLILLAKYGYTVYKADFGFADVQHEQKINLNFLKQRKMTKTYFKSPKKFYEKYSYYEELYAKEYELLSDIVDKIEPHIKQFVILADGLAEKSFDKIKNPARPIESCFFMSSIPEYKTSGFGFIEQTDPVTAKLKFNLKKDRTFFVPSYMAMKTKMAIEAQNDIN